MELNKKIGLKIRLMATQPVIDNIIQSLCILESGTLLVLESLVGEDRGFSKGNLGMETCFSHSVTGRSQGDARSGSVKGTT